MEAIILLTIAASMAFASMRWGYDSRDRLHSKEHQLAMYGVTWTEITLVIAYLPSETFVARQIEAILAQADEDSMLTLVGRPLLAAIVTITADVLTKEWAERVLTPHEPVPIVGQAFQLTLTYNSSVAFGLLAEVGHWVLVVSAAVILALGTFLVTTIRSGISPRTGFCLSLIIGGALANFADRWPDGRVTDFLDAGLAAMRWPTFNFADSSIVVGVCILLIASLRAAPDQTATPDGH